MRSTRAAEQSVALAEGRQRQFAGQLAQLQTELEDFETREAELARDYQRITGALPGRPHQQPTAEETDDLLA